LYVPAVLAWTGLLASITACAKLKCVDRGAIGEAIDRDRVPMIKNILSVELQIDWYNLLRAFLGEITLCDKLGHACKSTSFVVAVSVFGVVSAGSRVVCVSGIAASGGIEVGCTSGGIGGCSGSVGGYSCGGSG
jgi:hypothetical protein